MNTNSVFVLSTLKANLSHWKLSLISLLVIHSHFHLLQELLNQQCGQSITLNWNGNHQQVTEVHQSLITSLKRRTNTLRSGKDVEKATAINHKETSLDLLKALNINSEFALLTRRVLETSVHLLVHMSLALIILLQRLIVVHSRTSLCQL